MTETDEPPKAWHDPIVAEVRRVREDLFAAVRYDIREFCRRLHETQPGSGLAVVTRSPRDPDTSGEAA